MLVRKHTIFPQSLAAQLYQKSDQGATLLRWKTCQINLILTLSVEMMCENTNRSFRTHLAAILEKLTKAALVEISNLADECSSVLHTEISLQKTENEALKKRCYSLEVQLRAAREAQTYPAHVNSVSRRHPAGQRDRNTPLVRRPSQQRGLYSNRWFLSVW